MADSNEYSPSASQTLTAFTEIETMTTPGIGPTVSGGDVLTLAFLQWLTADDEDMQSRYRTYRNYYDGETEFTITDRMKEFLELDANVKFDLNYIPIPVDVLSERLKVAGFDAGEDMSIGGDEGILWHWWQMNRMDSVQGDVHHAALRDGDTYVLIGWNNELKIPTFSHETAFDGSNGISIRYSEETRQVIKHAVKRWRIESGPGAGTIQRMNVYVPDAIYKFISGPSGWQQFIEQDANGNDLPWPRLWVGADGSPLGVPVVHFRNNAGGYDFGKSELKDLVPVQDALNKAVLDELAGADTEGFRIPTLTGGSPPDDNFEIGPGRIWHTPNGTWGSIPAGDLRALSAVVSGFIVRMAQMSRTPLSYFQITGQVASAETQRADDTGLVSKSEKRGTEFGNAWEDVMNIGRKLNNAFGRKSMNPEQMISVVWADFERVDKGALDRTEAETADLKAQSYERLVMVGVDRLTAARLSGYSEEDAQDIAQTGGRILAMDEENAPAQSEAA